MTLAAAPLASTTPAAPVATPTAEAAPGQAEAGGHGSLGARLNWLRAAVLGANDGLVSGSGILIGVAAADPANSHVILAAGLAGLMAGAAAMAAGEYVSVSSQRDAEEALLAKEVYDLEHSPVEEFEELVGVYRAKGLSEPTARQVVTELTAHDAVAAHMHAEYGVDHEELTNPWHAAIASATSFTAGFLVPLLVIMLVGAHARILATVGAALVGLLATGWVSAAISGSPRLKPILRNLLGGSFAMALTWGIGHLFGVVAG